MPYFSTNFYSLIDEDLVPSTENRKKIKYLVLLLYNLTLCALSVPAGQVPPGESLVSHEGPTVL